MLLISISVLTMKEKSTSELMAAAHERDDIDVEEREEVSHLKNVTIDALGITSHLVQN